jgi:flagellar assembly protein FliH
MSSPSLVLFDRPLLGASVLPPSPSRQWSDAEIDELCTQARREGAEQARQAAGQDLLDLRSEVQQLQQQTLTAIAHAAERLTEQVRDALPALALEVGRRLLAEYEPPAEVVERICRASLEELFPETRNLELVLSPRDAELLDRTAPGWTRDYENLKVVVDPTFEPGDCQVRSRFGIVDARRATRLRALEETLSAP